MARAKDVRPGQVWTAKVSGKLTDVEILGTAGVTAKGRTKFQFKNLRTGRTAVGTAGKLRDLKRAAPGPAMPPTQEQVHRAPHRPARVRRRPAAPQPAPPPIFVNPLPIQETQALQRAPLWSPEQLVQPHELPSLRGQRRRSRRRSNPGRYPSPLAQAVCEAIAQTDGREWSIREAVDHVLGQGWAQRAGWERY